VQLDDHHADRSVRRHVELPGLVDDNVYPARERRAVHGRYGVNDDDR
jgi:hypothetical protein